MRSFVVALVLAALWVSAAQAQKIDWTKIPITRVEVGQTIEGSVDESDRFYEGVWRDWYTFSANAGETLTVSIEGGSEPTLGILEPRGAQQPSPLKISRKGAA